MLDSRTKGVFNLLSNVAACMFALIRSVRLSVNLFPAQSVCQSVIFCLLDKEIWGGNLCMCMCVCVWMCLNSKNASDSGLAHLFAHS